MRWRGTLTAHRICDSDPRDMPRVESVCVPALCDFTHEGRSYVRGDLVTLAPIHAAILGRARKVSLTRGYQAQAVQAEPEPEPKRRRRYRRRDMQAETE